MSFCKWLSGKSGANIRLPTEAEWEFAARGGLKSKGYIYAGSNDINEVAWYKMSTFNNSEFIKETASKRVVTISIPLIGSNIHNVI